MDLKSSVLLLILAVSFLPASANDFALVPEDNPVHVGDGAEFTCAGPSLSTNRQWLINGTQFESLNLPDVTLSGDRALSFTNIPLEYNGTTVQCTLTTRTGVSQLSTVGTLLVQGLLDAVSDVIVEYNSPTFIISWTAPFTYQVDLAPSTSYCISITNTSSGSILVNQTCELLNTNYSVELEYDPCVEYSATIIAVNPVGDGQPKVISFPAPGTLLLENFTARAEAGAVIFEGSLADPVCMCDVTLSVGGAAGTTTNCMANTNSTITFTITDLNLILSVDVTLHNANLSTSSEITISSYDVQSIAVDSPAPNAVTLNASYLENSPAMGVVFVLLFTDDADSVNFTKSLYLVLNRTESSDFLHNNVTQGHYDVLAFDVEEDGRLWSSPAVQETVTVSGEDLPPFPYPPVPAVTSCSTYLNGTNLTVSCDFNNDSVLGYYVLVQFEDLMTGELMLLTGETRDGSPVELNLPPSNLYNVVVFPLTGNGIVGTTVAFTEQVSSDSAVPPVPTSSTTVSTSPDVTSTSPASTSATTSGPGPLQGLGTGAVAAIVVVLLLVIALFLLLLLVILCCWFINRRGKHRMCKLETAEELEKNGGPSPEPQQANSLVNKKSVNELSSQPTQPPSEGAVQTDAASTSQPSGPVQTDGTSQPSGPVQTDGTSQPSEPADTVDVDQPKDPMYAEALAPANKEAEDSTTVQNDGATTTVGQGVLYEMVTVKEPKSQQKPEDNTTVQYDTVTKFAGGQGVLYEMVTVKEPKSKKVPEDPNKVEYAVLQLPPATSAPVKPTETQEPPAIPPRPAPPAPRKMTSEDMFETLLPIAGVWKDFAERMGCDEDRVDEIFTNNETDMECLRNTVDIYYSMWDKDKMASVLREMGEAKVARGFEDGKQADRPPLPGQAQDL